MLAVIEKQNVIAIWDLVGLSAQKWEVKSVKQWNTNNPQRRQSAKASLMITIFTIQFKYGLWGLRQDVLSFAFYEWLYVHFFLD